jgi:hypothetical protein
MTDHTPNPLPREWLPDPAGPAHPTDEAAWEARLRRLALAAEPALARLRTQPVPWWSALAAWWKPLVVAAAVAALAGVMLLPRLAPTPRTRSNAGVATISAIAGHGAPAALWAGLGSEADPALALITLSGDER